MTVTTEKVSYVDKELLKDIAEEGDRFGFNRQINPDFLDTLPEPFNFPVIFAMPHEHIAGSYATPHARCHVYCPDKSLFDLQPVVIDMTFERFDSLPFVPLVVR